MASHLALRPAVGWRAVVLPALLALVLAALVWVAWFAGSRAARHGPNGQVVNNVFFGELVSGLCVGQTFAAHTAGLYRIDVWLATLARVNHGPLLLHVRPAPFGANWATVAVEMDDLRDNAYHTFEFQPLALPAGVPGFFCLEAPDGSPGNTVTVGGNTADAFAEGKALLDTGEPAAGLADLRFQLYYRPGARLAVGEVLNRLAAGKPGLLGQRWLYLLLIGAFSLCLGWLGWAAGRQAIRFPDGTDDAPEPAAGHPSQTHE
jgi:hypothetical protein